MVAAQLQRLDYAPVFQMGYPLVFELASRLVEMVPGQLNHVVFANPGSEVVDTALKIALAYHRARGEGTGQRLIGRERGYHGVGGGIPTVRKFFGSLLTGVDHPPHSLENNAISRGLPGWDALGR